MEQRSMGNLIEQLEQSQQMKNGLVLRNGLELRNGRQLLEDFLEELVEQMVVD